MRGAVPFGPHPWPQRHWDARAALNFIFGGTGAGLIVFTAVAGGPAWVHAAGAAFVAAGLAAVALEIGRPLRALNVFRHPQRSWMSREAIAAIALLVVAALAAGGVPAAAGVAAALALLFVYCQARMLRAAKGIPAWRERRLAGLLLASALVEGGGLYLLLTSLAPVAPVSALGPAQGPIALVVALLWALALVARLALWTAWRERLAISPAASAASVVPGAPMAPMAPIAPIAPIAPAALRRIDADGRYVKAASWLPLAAILALAMAPLPPAANPLVSALVAAAGLLAWAGGAWFKFSLVLRVAFNQGFAIPHLPVRGTPLKAPEAHEAREACEACEACEA